MSQTMRAAVNTRYGPPDVIQIRDVPKPAPGEGEVLVKVHATTVNRTDCGFLRAHPGVMRVFTGLTRPKLTVLGMDYAGVVEAVGAGVTRFAPGERVFGMRRWSELGAHAEYLCAAERGHIATMPEGLAFGDAVVCEGAYYAYTTLQQLELKRGRKILIYGASGAIGTAAVQLARAMGAEVTAVVATRHLDMARALRPARVIDYTAEDFTRAGADFDSVMDAVGKESFFRCRKLLKPEGVFASTDAGPGGETIWLWLWTALTGSRRVRIASPRPVEGFIDYLKGLMQAGEFRGVIDRHYPLEQIADAYRYVETGQKTGIVVVDVAGA